MNNAMLSTPIGDLQHLSDWVDAHGGDNDDIPRIVEEMHDNDLTWRQMRPYKNVCFSVTAIRECLDLELPPECLEMSIDGNPLGYMVSNNDITASEARQLWEDSQ